MRRLFWFGLGVTLTAVAVWKARELLEKATPKGLQDQVTQQFTKTQAKAKGSLAEFFDTVQSAAAEREIEIREALGLVEEVDEPAAKRVAAGATPVR